LPLRWEVDPRRTSYTSFGRPLGINDAPVLVFRAPENVQLELVAFG
jgi:hypothetical protein